MMHVSGALMLHVSGARVFVPNRGVPHRTWFGWVYHWETVLGRCCLLNAQIRFPLWGGGGDGDQRAAHNRCGMIVEMQDMSAWPPRLF